MFSRKRLSLLALVCGVAALITGCSTDLSPEPFDASLRLTAGHVKMAVKPTVTTQAEIFKSLGAPNVVTLESGKGEVWTYDQIRIRRTTQGYGAGAFFATLFPFSSGSLSHGAGAAGANAAATVGTDTTSVVTATLIVNFDKNETVSSYKMLVTSF